MSKNKKNLEYKTENKPRRKNEWRNKKIKETRIKIVRHVILISRSRLNMKERKKERNFNVMGKKERKKR